MSQLAHLYQEIEELTAERDFYKDQVEELTKEPVARIYRLGFTPQECRILGLMMRRRGQLVSRTSVEIAAQVKDQKDERRTVNVVLAKIRAKFRTLGIEQSISKWNPEGWVLCPKAADKITELAEEIEYEQIVRTQDSSGDSKLVTGQSPTGEHIFCRTKWGNPKNDNGEGR